MSKCGTGTGTAQRRQREQACCHGGGGSVVVGICSERRSGAAPAFDVEVRPPFLTTERAKALPQRATHLTLRHGTHISARASQAPIFIY